jgi:RHS repeat-associated protein
MQDTLGLKETIVEPGAGSDPASDPDRPDVLETHTAFVYDRFGHVVKTTECASDYNDCSRPGAEGPTDALDANTPRFRITRVSYDPQDFSVTPPSDGGDEEFTITTGLSYDRGRFPVRTIDPEGHASYSAFNPSTGTLIQETDPNGIFTCRKYDEFSNPIAVSARCGTQKSVVTRTRTYHSPPALIATRPFMTVSKSTTGDAKWTYSDVLGRSRETLVRGFAGGFVHSGVVMYDSIGRAVTETAPYLDTDGGPASTTTYLYDSLNRLYNVAKDLGAIGPDNPDGASVVTTFFQGFSICTERVVKGRIQVRVETKNPVGKISSITTLMDNGSDDGPAQTCSSHNDYGPGSLQAKISYGYDADGNLTSVIDDAGNVTGLGYDLRGRKTSVNDPDMRGWTYSYDGFGQLISQIDAKLQKTTMIYDRLGRVLRKGPIGDTQAEWVYDTAPGKGIGRLAAMVSRPDARLKGPCAIPGTSQTDGNRSGRSFSYDDRGAVSNVSECTDGETFDTTYDYDRQGRTSAITYPGVVGNPVAGNRLAVGYHYTATNRLQYVFDLSDNSVLWSATAVNALGQIVKETTRNGVETVSQRNPVTGWLMGATSTAYLDGSTLIQDRSYGYDEAGNLRARTRNEPLNGPAAAETFTYDAADRLTNAQTTIAANGYVASDAYGYDSIGNLTTKGGKTYSYGSCQNAGPHAICPSDVGDAFSYDPNGNMTSGHGRTATYSAANKALYVTKDTVGIDFVYGADDQHVVQEKGTTDGAGATERIVYAGLSATGKSLYERTTKSATGTVEHVHFIYAGAAHGGNAFALRTVTTSTDTTVTASVSTRYYHGDHLGSVIAWSDEVGHVSAPVPDAPDSTTLSYDAWGARRATDGHTLAPPAAAALSPPPGHREFTGHEVIPGVGLVNMNGRIYDPELGRFLSPDPNVQFVAELQSYNRYAYVLNNPLRSTDPTGYSASSVFKGFLNSFPNPYSDPFYDDPNGLGWWTSNPERAAKTVLTVGTAVVGSVACAYSSGAGCVAAMAMIAAINANMMIAEGASLKQTLVVTGISIIASGFGGAAAGATTGMTHAMIQGVVSGAMSAAITGIAYHQRDLGANILVSALQGAAMAALTTGLTRAVPMSRAEAAAQDPDEGGETVDSVLAANGVTGLQIGSDEALFDADMSDSFRSAAQARGDFSLSAGTGMAVGPDGMPVQVAWTVELGLGLNFQLGPININFSTGIAFDGSGNLATYNTPGGGLGVGALASGGFQVQSSNAATVYDLKGAFYNTSSGAGLGPSASWETFSGPSDHGFVAGWGITAGVGVGGGGCSWWFEYVLDSPASTAAVKSTLILKMIIVILASVFFVALGRGIYLEMSYAARLPRIADPSSGRIHQISVQHGTRVFASNSEVADLQRSEFLWPSAWSLALAQVF